MYSAGRHGENYLRGVQETDANGDVTFTSIFPAVLLGPLAAHPLRGVPEPRQGDERREQDRRPRSSRSPADACNAVYATDGYSQSVRNLAQTSLQTDMVFSDGYTLQVPTFTGSPTAGYVATIPVAV